VEMTSRNVSLNFDAKENKFILNKLDRPFFRKLKGNLEKCSLNLYKKNVSGEVPIFPYSCFIFLIRPNLP